MRARGQKGTAVIRGRVVAADTGLPIRQASVNLFPSGRGQIPPALPNVLSARTDDQGNFDFKALPAGDYRVTASPSQHGAQYLASSYGGTRPSLDLGTPITVSEGQTFDTVTIALPRGAVIAGRVTDEGGDPMARVQVYALFFRPGSKHGEPSSNAQTDDLGQFRLFSLPPGEYAVVAEVRMTSFVNPNMVQKENGDDRNGFLTTFYPGTPDEGSAQHVRTRAGAETTGVEMRMVRARLFRMSGIVMDSQGNPMARANGHLTRRTAAFLMSGGGFISDEQGRFQLQNLAPGTYQLIVRHGEQTLGPDGTEGDPGETAIVPITIAAADLENLVVVTAPGTTLRGRVQFEPGPPEHPVEGMHVRAMPADPELPTFGPAPRALVQSDLTFRLQGLSGEQLIRTEDGLPSNRYVKAVLLEGNDISDTPTRFKPQDRVTIVVSSRGATLEGTVMDANGTPTSKASIILFPDDKASWRENSIDVHRSFPDSTGHYRITPLRPGRYFILAAAGERLNTFPGVDYVAFYDELSKDATMLVVNEDETRSVDLKVTESGGDP